MFIFEAKFELKTSFVMLICGLILLVDIWRRWSCYIFLFQTRRSKHFTDTVFN